MRADEQGACKDGVGVASAHGKGARVGPGGAHTKVGRMGPGGGIAKACARGQVACTQRWGRHCQGGAHGKGSRWGQAVCNGASGAGRGALQGGGGRCQRGTKWAVAGAQVGGTGGVNTLSSFPPFLR